MTQPVRRKKRKTRRRIRKSVLYAAIAILVLILALLFVPNYLTENKLKSLGYSKDSIAAIKKHKITDEIIDEELYSDNLNTVLPQENFKRDYLKLYLAMPSIPEEKELLLFDKLSKKGYSEANRIKLFGQLQFFEMTPLLVFDMVSDIPGYIQDCLDHRDVNSNTHFELAGNYFSHYEDTSPADDTQLNMLVNKRYYLTEDYNPEDMITLKLEYATKDSQMRQEAADAFAKLCEGVRENEGMRIYASSTYRDYAYQVDLYDGYVASMGQEATDKKAARPGYSEHQTGLTVDVASSTGGQLSKFNDAKEYPWLRDNSYRYGFILRYPQGKEIITGYSFESWHYRYLGVELATKVYESGLTYDEYYALYIQ